MLLLMCMGHKMLIAMGNTHVGVVKFNVHRACLVGPGPTFRWEFFVLTEGRATPN